DHRMVGTVGRTQCDQRVDVAAGREHAGAHRARMAGDDVERRPADRAGRAKDGDALHQNPSQIFATANTGRAASTLSMRSSTPPWPGISVPESFAPTWRLSRLSNRSPITENSTVATAATATSGSCPALAPASGAMTSATTTPAATPPSMPSMVLFGLIRGASLRRPNLRPAK